MCGASASGTSTAQPVFGDYDGLRENAQRTLHKAWRKGDDPRAAAELIWKAARGGVPLGRYGIGRGAAVVPLSKTLLPQRVFDRLLRRSYRLPR